MSPAQGESGSGSLFWYIVLFVVMAGLAVGGGFNIAGAGSSPPSAPAPAPSVAPANPGQPNGYCGTDFVNPQCVMCPTGPVCP